jgi:phage gp36-like protein
VYLTPADLLARFGAEELAPVADRATPREVTPELLAKAIAGDPLSGWADSNVAAVTAAVARLTSTLEDAQSAVDAYLSGRYRTPLATVPLVIQRLVADVARYYLYGDRASDPIRQTFEAAMGLCRDIAAGKVSFGDEVMNSPKAHGGVELVSSPRLWSREQRGL